MNIYPFASQPSQWLQVIQGQSLSCLPYKANISAAITTSPTLAAFDPSFPPFQIHLPFCPSWAWPDNLPFWITGLSSLGWSAQNLEENEAFASSSFVESGAEEHFLCTHMWANAHMGRKGEEAAKFRLPFYAKFVAMVLAIVVPDVLPVPRLWPYSPENLQLIWNLFKSTCAHTLCTAADQARLQSKEVYTDYAVLHTLTVVILRWTLNVVSVAYYLENWPLLPLLCKLHRVWGRPSR